MKRSRECVASFLFALLVYAAAPAQTRPAPAPPQSSLPSASPAAPSQLALAPDHAWWSDSGQTNVSAPRYASVARSSRFITMRDGVRLAADVYLPRELEAGVRLPTILEQTRYHRSLQPRPNAPPSADEPRERVREFVTRGYAYVVVDVRGTGASFGSRRAELSPEEVRDGAEVVGWIVRQSWSDGRVGATGVSYVGTTAELLLVNRHPVVKAVAPQFSLFDTYADIVFPGGLHQTWFTQIWQGAIRGLDQNRILESARARYSGVRPVDEDGDGSLLRQAISDHAANLDVHAQTLAVTFRDDRTPLGWTFDDISPHAQLRHIRASNAAVYSYSGWYDGAYARSAVNRFRTVRTPGSRLVIGPWNHGGAFYFSPGLGARRSSFPHTRELLRFFDYHLKGIANGIEREPLVYYYTMGEERWHTAETFPPPEARTLVWYFANDNTLRRTRPPRNAETFDTYQVDLTAGTGTGSRWNTIVGGGMVDYPDRSAEDRKLLTYTSAPLDADMEATGFPVVTLFADSTATDDSFFVYLEEVDENGRVRHVTEGNLRAVHRRLNGGDRAYNTATPYRTFLRRDTLPLVPGRTAELTFELVPTSYLFRRGSRVRVAIAGIDRDHFAPLSAEAPTWRVHRGLRGASHISLPVMPRRARAGDRRAGANRR